MCTGKLSSWQTSHTGYQYGSVRWGRGAGISPRQLKPSDLDPVKVWASIDDRVHRTWDRAVKYYENLRLVYEIQSRLREWNQQEEEERKTQQQPSTPPGQPNQGGPDQQQRERSKPLVHRRHQPLPIAVCAAKP